MRGRNRALENLTHSSSAFVMITYVARELRATPKRFSEARPRPVRTDSSGDAAPRHTTPERVGLPEQGRDGLLHVPQDGQVVLARLAVRRRGDPRARAERVVIIQHE